MPTKCVRRNRTVFGFLGLWVLIMYMLLLDEKDHATMYWKSTASNSNSTRTVRASKRQPKVAIYMTTSNSALHNAFLQKCWPTAFQNIPLVHNADLIVYSSGDASASHKDLFRNIGFRNVSFHYFQEHSYNDAKLPPFIKSELQKQWGAIHAMLDPFQDENRWFDGYDWIVRLNPDVLIRNDTWLWETMQNESTDAILGNYSDGVVLHTDFTVFRPTAMNATALWKAFREQERTNRLHAEKHIYHGLTRVLEQGRAAWIPNIQLPPMRAGRIGGPDCDVVHDHRFIRFCPNYLNLTVTMVGPHHELVSS